MSKRSTSLIGAAVALALSGQATPAFSQQSTGAGENIEEIIVSGIRGSYGEPEKLVGRQVVFIANLAPRKMRFGVSEGMILSAGGDDGLFLLDADAGAKPGMPVK